MKSAAWPQSQAGAGSVGVQAWQEITSDSLEEEGGMQARAREELARTEASLTPEFRPGDPFSNPDQFISNPHPLWCSLRFRITHQCLLLPPTWVGKLPLSSQAFCVHTERGKPSDYTATVQLAPLAPGAMMSHPAPQSASPLSKCSGVMMSLPSTSGLQALRVAARGSKRLTIFFLPTIKAVSRSE